MKKAKYKVGGYKKHTPIKAGELMRVIDPLSPSGRGDFTAMVLSDHEMEIIEPSDDQCRDSALWQGHVSIIEPNWYLFRGLEVVE